MTVIRDFGTIEQALAHSLKSLKEEEVKAATGKSLSHFRKCSDSSNKDNVLHLEDAIKLDIILDRQNEGTPLLNTFLHIIEKKRSESNMEGSIEQSIMQIVSRIGKLTDVTEKALDPKSPGGTSLNTQEKDKIYKALKEVEARIASLKKSID
jgi:hypothetical protein